MIESAERPDGAVEHGAVATAGQLLRAAREKQGLHLAALATALKVTPQKLELLETDRYDELPDATFTRALALSVCRVLKIDATPVLVRLPQSSDHGLEHVARGLNQPFRDRIARHEPGEWRRFLSLPAIGAVLLLVAAAVVYLMPDRPLALPALGSLQSLWQGGASAPAPAASVAPPSVPVVAEPASEAASAAASLPFAMALEAASAPTAVSETVFSAPPAASGEGATAGLLALRASGSSWIEVRDRDGRVLLSRTLSGGETVGVDGALPLKVVIGNADVTQLSFRGQPVALAAVTKDNVARLELK
jgi:cytoskeleton protein RodZ